MLKMGNGIRDFFRKRVDELVANDEILRYKELVDYVFDHSINFKENPSCHAFYVTTGKWTNDANLKNVVDSNEEQLRNLNYFDDVRFIPIDALRLTSVYKEIRSSVTRQIVIAKNVAFPPDISGVEQAYLGLVRFDEYMKLVCDEDGMLQYGLFYDNVRSYLGENPVNSEIMGTLSNPAKQVQFPILNNGITIVAKQLKSSGDKFTLTDFQIVNGCQTTNVLYRCREHIKSDMMIPVKIVNTEQPDLINDVIRSTNRQTQVLDEAFEALKDFHKQLQDYYNTYTGADRIYYERRSHEYVGEDSEVKRSNITSIPSQLYSVMSMFFNEPHSVHRYYGELLRSNASRVFQTDHKLIMYYTSAWTLHRIEEGIREGQIDSKWRKYRYHLLLLIQTYLRLLKRMKEPVRPNSKDMEFLCKSILDTVNDNVKLGAVLRFLVTVLSKALIELETDDKRNPPTRLKEFTQHILSLLAEEYKKQNGE